MKRTIWSFITCCGAAAAFALAGISSSSAATIALWTFETSVPATAGPFSAEGGANAGATSQASALHSNASTVYSNPSGNGSVESYSSNFWSQNDYYQFTTSTTGFFNIQFFLDQTRSSTGPANFKIQADTGSGFADVGSPYVVAANTWSGTAVPSSYGPFSLGAAAANKPLITIRVVNLDSGVATAGTNRVDNVTIADGAPEPATATLALCSVLSAVAIRRRAR